jgi:mannose-6-phosphate isomerase-like protein (cupin superfamily)
MAGYAITSLEDVPDVLGDYPGEMRMCAGPLEAEQVAFTWRRMPAGTGGKGSYGHRHRTQEEVYFVAAGTLEFKLDDEVIELGAGNVVRISPEVARSVWNEGPDDAVLVIVSTRSADLEAEVESVPDFWPA